jgi:hypothetical protein
VSQFELALNCIPDLELPMLNRLFFIFPLIAIFGAGCAFGTRTAVLDYPGDGPWNAPAGAPLVRITEFDDGRAQTDVGDVRNGYGMRTARVVTTSDVAEWVTEAVATELGAKGFDVETEGGSADPVLVVTGRVVEAYTTMKRRLRVFSVDVVVSRDGEVLLEERYSGTPDRPRGVRGEAYAEALNEVMQLVANRIADDVDELME